MDAGMWWWYPRTKHRNTHTHKALATKITEKKIYIYMHPIIKTIIFF